MSVFVRKNLLVATATFTAADGSATQPSSVMMEIRYTDVSGVSRQVEVDLTYIPLNNVWAGTWDTSAAKYGNVDWVIYGVGSLQAATQGSFQIDANSANNV